MWRAALAALVHQESRDGKRCAADDAANSVRDQSSSRACHHLTSALRRQLGNGQGTSIHTSGGEIVSCCRIAISPMFFAGQQPFDNLRFMHHELHKRQRHTGTGRAQCHRQIFRALSHSTVTGLATGRVALTRISPSGRNLSARITQFKPVNSLSTFSRHSSAN